MSYRKFGKNDLLVNTLRSYPKVKFDIYNGSVYYNNIGTKTGHFRLHPNNAYMTDTGYENLHEINVDRLADQNPLIYPYVPKDGSRTSLWMTGLPLTDEEYAEEEYGDLFQGSYPQFASISREYIEDPSGSCDARSKSDCAHNFSYFSLKPLLNHYATLSPHYKVKMDSTFQGGWNKDNQKINLIHIPSIFYGTKIRPGTVKLRFYHTGSLIGELSDEKENGELIQTLPTGSLYSGSVAGVVLYNEGFLLLTGSWTLQRTGSALNYEGKDNPRKLPRWRYWGASMPVSRGGVAIDPDANDADSLSKASFSLSFDGIDRTQVLTMNAHAPRGKVNYSNNPSFIEHGQRFFNLTSSQVYEENPQRIIKNTVSSSFSNHLEDFKRQVYISKIGVYDENKNLIGIATLANPVLKEEQQNYTFRIKLDI